MQRAVAECSVFGRVTPQQKKQMVQALQSQKHTVAMTGDGVNDVLALKEADCSIAMAAGSDAAKNIANVVLLDSNFGAMPHIVNQGRSCCKQYQKCGIHVSDQNNFFGFTVIDHNFLWRCISL